MSQEESTLDFKYETKRKWGTILSLTQMQAKSLAYRLDKAISIYREVIKELYEISVSDQEKEERQNLAKATNDKMELAIQEISLIKTQM